MISSIQTTLCAVLKTAQRRFFSDTEKFWERDISSAWERAFPGVFLVAQLPQNRQVLVKKNSLASCQRCRHSVESRALTFSFKQSNLSVWSLLSWHPTHTYLSGRLCFIQVACSPLSRSRRVTQSMSAEARILNASLASFSPSMNWQTE